MKRERRNPQKRKAPKTVTPKQRRKLSSFAVDSTVKTLKSPSPGHPSQKKVKRQLPSLRRNIRLSGSTRDGTRSLALKSSLTCLPSLVKYLKTRDKKLGQTKNALRKPSKL